MFPFAYANALPGNAELVLENLQISPPYPQKGELVKITADVYNAGIVETNSLASIITAAYFVDGELLYLNEIDNVKPGIGNKISISSDLIWNAEPGNYNMKIILDYHDTLNDQYDSPEDNVLEKIISIRPLTATKMQMQSSPQYIGHDTNTLLTATISLVDSDTHQPLNNKKITLTFDEENISLVTNADGVVSFSKMVDSLKELKLHSSFGGDAKYLPTNSSLTVYSIPSEITSAMIVKILNAEKQYNFVDSVFEFIIFQDSYDTLIETVSPNSTMIVSDVIWVSLPPEHDYFVEAYLDGQLFYLSDKKYLDKNSIIMEELSVPESAEIQFKIINGSGAPQGNATVNNWIYSTVSDDDGLTDWIRVLPTLYQNPYVADIILSDGRAIKSDPFFIFSGERKTINLNIPETLSAFDNIPSWIRTNAGWWADGQIDNESFIDAIQFLVKKNILHVPLSIDSDDFDYDNIPSWIKNSAGWWADGQIDNESFIDAIQFLINKEILKIP